jgi:D-specific alpha-keto acid dehydrogenase
VDGPAGYRGDIEKCIRAGNGRAVWLNAMNAHLTSPPAGVTVYGCEADEAAMFRTLAPHFGVAARIAREPATPDTIELAAGNRCISIGHKRRLTTATITALGGLGVQYISTRSIGCDPIDVRHAHSLGIRVEGVAYSPAAVGDYTLMLILMAVRHAKTTMRAVEAHDFRLGAARGRELRDMTVGVVGAGRIGSAVIRRLQGFGCRILVHDIRPADPGGVCPGGVRVGWEELARNSDIVTLHIPLTPGTRHILDRTRIGELKAGAVLVNTGRGELVDTQALIAALNDGRLGGAALDVLEGEEGLFYADWSSRPLPHPALAQLQQMPNVVISPHTAFYTDRALRDTVENSLINCAEFARGRHHG